MRSLSKCARLSSSLRQCRALLSLLCKNEVDGGVAIVCGCEIGQDSAELKPVDLQVNVVEILEQQRSVGSNTFSRIRFLNWSAL